MVRQKKPFFLARLEVLSPSPTRCLAITKAANTATQDVKQRTRLCGAPTSSKSPPILNQARLELCRTSADGVNRTLCLAQFRRRITLHGFDPGKWFSQHLICHVDSDVADAQKITRRMRPADVNRITSVVEQRHKLFEKTAIIHIGEIVDCIDTLLWLGVMQSVDDFLARCIVTKTGQRERRCMAGILVLFPGQARLQDRYLPFIASLSQQQTNRLSHIFVPRPFEFRL